jgi:phage baseplate assembly protein W
MTEDDRAFLGRGWAFPPRLGPGGDVALVSAEDDIRQAIRIIIETAPGERPMRPEFGIGIRRLVFAPLTSGTLSVVRFRVEQGLIRWEPRIDSIRADVRVDPDNPGVLLIDIRYRVRDTNTFFNFVYPYYLAEARPT